MGLTDTVSAVPCSPALTLSPSHHIHAQDGAAHPGMKVAPQRSSGELHKWSWHVYEGPRANWVTLAQLSDEWDCSYNVPPDAFKPLLKMYLHVSLKTGNKQICNIVKVAPYTHNTKTGAKNTLWDQICAGESRSWSRVHFQILLQRIMLLQIRDIWKTEIIPTLML